MKMKFWDKEEKRMIGPNLDPEQYQIISYNGLALIDNEREDEDGWPYQMDVEFLRYTGLKDANGREIYEGDIIEYHSANDRKRLLQVTWSDADAMFEFSGVRHDYATKGKVIGNIYETPELLKKDE